MAASPFSISSQIHIFDKLLLVRNWFVILNMYFGRFAFLLHLVFRLNFYLCAYETNYAYAGAHTALGANSSNSFRIIFGCIKFYLQFLNDLLVLEALLIYYLLCFPNSIGAKDRRQEQMQ